MNANTGFIYVLTNPSFPEYVKIGYSNNPKRRVEELNRSTGLPFAFRLHCTLQVSEHLTDKTVHKIIDALHPGLRSVEKIDGRLRIREFYRMSAEEAFNILNSVAVANGIRNGLHLYIHRSEMEKQDADTGTSSSNIKYGAACEDEQPNIVKEFECLYAMHVSNQRAHALDVKNDASLSSASESKMTGKLTEQAIKDLKADGRHRRRLSDGHRLYIVAMPSGTKRWEYEITDNQGREHRRALGIWPAIGIDEARRLHKNLRVQFYMDSFLDKNSIDGKCCRHDA